MSPIYGIEVLLIFNDLGDFWQRYKECSLCFANRDAPLDLVDEFIKYLQ